MHQDRNVRRLPARMDLPKRCRQVSVDANHERHASDPGHRAAYATCVADGDHHGCNNSQRTDLQRDRTHGNRVKHAAGGGYLRRRNQCHHRDRRHDVHPGNQHSRCVHRSRQRFLGVAHFLAHRGNKLQPAKRKCNLRPEVHGIPIPDRQHVSGREVRGRAMLHPQNCCDAQQRQQRQIRRHAARILQPFADVQSDDIQSDRHHEHAYRHAKQEHPVLRKRRAVLTDDVSAHRRTGQQQPGKIEYCVDPIVPASHEAVKISEPFLGPDVQPAFFRES